MGILIIAVILTIIGLVALFSATQKHRIRNLKTNSMVYSQSNNNANIHVGRHTNKWKTK